MLQPSSKVNCLAQRSLVIWGIIIIIIILREDYLEVKWRAIKGRGHPQTVGLNCIQSGTETGGGIVIIAYMGS